MVDVWFHATQKKYELFFDMKLRLYEEACVSIAESFYRNHNCTDPVVMEKMEQELWPCFLNDIFITKPLATRNAYDFTDAIERQLHVAFSGLDNGYTINEEDKIAFEHAMFPSTMHNAAVSSADMGCKPQLYGELTSMGVRQLHRIVLQCLGQIGVVTYLDKGKKDEKAAHCSSPRRFHSLVAIDIGSGTGKLLFEWSLLSQRDAPQLGWTHVGLELAPSRMSVARSAIPGSASLAYCHERRRWCVETKCGGYGERGVRVVLGEADVFAPGLLSNETFFPIASSVAVRALGISGCGGGDRDIEGDDDAVADGLSCHLAIFFCGLGFAEYDVRELCAGLERMWLTPHISSSSLSSSWKSLTCVFLLRKFVELDFFPLFSFCTKTSGPVDSNANYFYKVALNTTWMDDAPAWVLSLSRV